MIMTIVFALIAIGIAIYGILEKDEQKRKKNIKCILIGVTIFLLYLFASNGRFHEEGAMHLDKWFGVERFLPSMGD